MTFFYFSFPNLTRTQPTHYGSLTNQKSKSKYLVLNFQKWCLRLLEYFEGGKLSGGKGHATHISPQRGEGGWVISSNILPFL